MLHLTDSQLAVLTAGLAVALITLLMMVVCWAARVVVRWAFMVVKFAAVLGAALVAAILVVPFAMAAVGWLPASAVTPGEVGKSASDLLYPIWGIDARSGRSQVELEVDPVTGATAKMPVWDDTGNGAAARAWTDLKGRATSTISGLVGWSGTAGFVTDAVGGWIRSSAASAASSAWRAVTAGTIKDTIKDTISRATQSNTGAAP